MAEVKQGSCHCGAVKFEVTLNAGLKNLMRCNCSLCRRRGAIVVSVPHEQVVITQGEDNLALYQWNTKVAKHYFCKTCGIYTHHHRRSVPSESSVNVACIDGFDPYGFGGDIVMVDGASNSLLHED